MDPIPIPYICGVYRLFLEGRVVYIGSSIRVMHRIYTHALEGTKKFDAYNYQECAPEEMLDLECAEIIKHSPEYNYAMPLPAAYLSTVCVRRLLNDDWRRRKLENTFHAHGVFPVVVLQGREIWSLAEIRAKCLHVLA